MQKKGLGVVAWASLSCCYSSKAWPHISLRTLLLVASHQVPPPFCSVVSGSEGRSWWRCLGLEWLLLFPTCRGYSSCLFRRLWQFWVWGSPRLHSFVWPCGCDNVDISVKELVPVVVAVALRGERWKRKHICFHSDNNLVSILKSRTTHFPAVHALIMLSIILLCYLQFQYVMYAYPWGDNVVADALSRDNILWSLLYFHRPC